VSDKNELFFNLNQKVLYSYNNGDTLYDITTGLTSDVERLYLFGDNDAYAVCKDGVYRLHNSITSNLPLKISLQSPANNSQIPSGVKGSTVTCIWDSAINADYYELIVGDSLFQKVSCFFTKIKDNFLAFSVNEKTNYWKVRAVNNFGKGEWSDTRCFRIGTLMNAENKTLPTETTLSQNYPNPFNPSTTISYSMSDDANVSIEIFNTLGSKVKTLVNEKISKGSHEIVWNGMDEFSKIVSTGIYYCTMRAGNFMKTIKLNFLK
jgi:hypothetical protein